MGRTRSFRKTVVRRVQDDPKFRVALMEEASRTWPTATLRSRWDRSGTL